MGACPKKNFFTQTSIHAIGDMGMGMNLKREFGIKALLAPWPPWKRSVGQLLLLSLSANAEIHLYKRVRVWKGSVQLGCEVYTGLGGGLQKGLGYAQG